MQRRLLAHAELEVPADVPIQPVAAAPGGDVRIQPIQPVAAPAKPTLTNRLPDNVIVSSAVGDKKMIPTKDIEGCWCGLSSCEFSLICCCFAGISGCTLLPLVIWCGSRYTIWHAEAKGDDELKISGCKIMPLPWPMCEEHRKRKPGTNGFFKVDESQSSVDIRGSRSRDIHTYDSSSCHFDECGCMMKLGSCGSSGT